MPSTLSPIPGEYASNNNSRGTRRRRQPAEYRQKGPAADGDRRSTAKRDPPQTATGGVPPKGTRRRRRRDDPKKGWEGKLQEVPRFFSPIFSRFAKNFSLWGPRHKNKHTARERSPLHKNTPRPNPDPSKKRTHSSPHAIFRPSPKPNPIQTPDRPKIPRAKNPTMPNIHTSKIHSPTKTPHA